MNKFVCRKCDKSYSLWEEKWKCECDGLLDIEFNARFPIEEITQRKPTIWRYKEAIPIEEENIISFGEGFTPLLPVELEDKLVWVKQEQYFPTGSFKDRGGAVLISKINELGIQKIIEDSSGNAGCAIAAYSAKAGIECVIFVPATASTEKIVQIRAYGAKINKISGSREETADAAFQAAEKYYYASHAWNPFFLQGTKTFAYEVCEQLGWESPEAVVLPVGNGTLFLGAFIGFQDLARNNIIDELPKLVGVQPENCAPIYHAFKKGRSKVSSIPEEETIAGGIRIPNPVRGTQILTTLRKTGGKVIIVSDKEIKQALQKIWAQGYYIEPTSGIVIPGVKKYAQYAPEETIVTAFTGHGLKTSQKISHLLSNSFEE